MGEARLIGIGHPRDLGLFKVGDGFLQFCIDFQGRGILRPAQVDATQQIVHSPTNCG